MDRTSPEYPGIEDCVPRARLNKARRYVCMPTSMPETPAWATRMRNYRLEIAYDSSAVGTFMRDYDANKERQHPIRCYPLPALLRVAGCVERTWVRGCYVWRLLNEHSLPSYQFRLSSYVSRTSAAPTLAEGFSGSSECFSTNERLMKTFVLFPLFLLQT
jgi:hypothetical protein